MAKHTFNDFRKSYNGGVIRNNGSSYNEEDENRKKHTFRDFQNSYSSSKTSDKDSNYKIGYAASRENAEDIADVSIPEAAKPQPTLLDRYLDAAKSDYYDDKGFFAEDRYNQYVKEMHDWNQQNDAIGRAMQKDADMQRIADAKKTDAERLADYEERLNPYKDMNESEEQAVKTQKWFDKFADKSSKFSEFTHSVPEWFKKIPNPVGNVIDLAEGVNDYLINPMAEAATGDEWMDTEQRAAYDSYKNTPTLSETEKYDYMNLKKNNASTEVKAAIDKMQEGYYNKAKYDTSSMYSSGLEASIQDKMLGNDYLKKANLIDEGRNDLIALGLSDDEIKSYEDIAERLANKQEYDEKYSDNYINEDDSTTEKILKGAFAFGMGRVNNFGFGANLNNLSLGSMLEDDPNNLGRDKHSSFNKYKEFSEYLDQGTLNAMGEPTTKFGKAVNNFTGQTIGKNLYQWGAMGVDSALNMAAAGAVSDFLGVTGSGKTVEGLAKAGKEIPKAVSKAAQVEDLVQKISLVPYAASGYEEGYWAAKDAGLSDGEAQVRGLVGGWAEYFTERVSLDAVWDVYSGSKAGRNKLLQFLVPNLIEGSEEVNSDLINDAADYIISHFNDHDSEFEKAINEYHNSHYTSDNGEAIKAMFKDKVAQYLTDFIGGAVTGMPRSALAVHSSVNRANYMNKAMEGAAQENFGEESNYGKNYVQLNADIMEEGKEKAEMQKLADKVEKGKKLTRQNKYDIAQLSSQAKYNEYASEILAGEKVAITEDQARENIAKAINDNNVPALEKVYADMTNSTDANLAANAKDILREYEGYATESHQIDVDVFRAITEENTAISPQKAKKTMVLSAMANVPFEKALNDNKLLYEGFSETQLKKYYDIGIEERQRDESKNAAKNEFMAEAFKKYAPKDIVPGKIINEDQARKAGTSEDVITVARVLSNITGFDVNIAPNLENLNGITQNASINFKNKVINISTHTPSAAFHEAIGEFTQEYNKSGHDALMTDFMGLMADEFGSTFTKLTEQYQSAYTMAEGKYKSQTDAMREMVNDFIPTVLSTEKGAKAFADYIAKNYHGEEAERKGNALVKFIRKIANAIRNLLKGENFNNDWQRDLVNNRANDLEKFADRLVEEFGKAVENYSRIQNEDINTSVLSEEEKNSLSVNSNGDVLTEEQSTFFKNAKTVDKNGHLKIYYHGSSNYGFTVFDIRKAKPGLYGRGFYFTDSISHAGTYGKTYTVYLNLVNPLQIGDNNITDKQMLTFINAIASDEDYGIENYGENATPQSILKSLDGKDDFSKLQDINATCIGDFCGAIKLFNNVNGTNYDGIIAPTETVAFYANQIKDISNVKPTNDADIRFCLDVESSTVSNAMAYDEKGRLVLENADALSDADWKQITKSFNLLGYGLENPTSAKEIFTRLSSERPYVFNADQADALRKLFNIPSKDPDINLNEISDKKKAEYVSKAEKLFGTTSRFDLAGYLTTNGTLLDFSDGQRYRVRDHREISEVLDLPEDAGYSDGLIEFMNQGNIRLQSYGIDIAQMPNDKQIKMLRNFFNKLEGEVTVDFSSYQGANIGSVEYSEGTASSRILNDITSFYETGVVPEGTAGGINDFIRYSIETDINGKKFVYVDEDIINGINDTKQIKEYVKEYIREYFDTIDVYGQNVDFVNKGIKEFTNSEYTKYLIRKYNDIFVDKMRLASKLDELIDASENYQYEYPNHKRKDNIIGFVRGKVRIKVFNNDYIADVIFADRDKGEVIFYDVVNIDQTTIKTAAKPIAQNNGIGEKATVYTNNIQQSDTEVNSVMNEGTDTRESLSIDSLGRELSEGQKEYFKNSMVVDENGRLKVMYHGSHNDFGFTVFDANHSDDGRSLFFTSKRKIAQSYASSDTKFKAKESYTIDDLHNLVDNFFTQIKKDGDVYKINQYTYGPKLVSTDFEGNFEELRDYVLDMYGDTSGNGYYEVYLNITNPLVIDADGHYWDELPNLEDPLGLAWTTRDVSEYAQNNGYDGVIFNNIIDNPNGNFEEDTVVIAFDSNQVKSVDNLNPTDNEDIRYSVVVGTDEIKTINDELKTFKEEIDSWDGKDATLHFNVGKTSTVLKNLGMDDNVIELDSSKLIKILKNHPEMKTLIYKLPEILHDPVIVMSSLTDTESVVILGNVLDDNNNPMIAILLQNPITKRGIQLDITKVKSSYVKDNMKSMLRNSDIYYKCPDKKITTRFESLTGLQLPFVRSTNGYVKSIQNLNKKVNNDIRFSLNIDEDFDNLLDDIDISDEDFNAWMWEINNLPTEEKPKRVISRRHLTRLAMGKEFQVVDGKKLAYTDERIASLYGEYANSSQEYSKAYVTYMSPADFLLLTANSDKGTKVFDRIANESSSLDMDNLKNESQPIFLTVALKEDGSRKDEVIGHEGRHRMYALAQAGFTQVPVVVVDYNNKYSKKPIDSVKVYPQSWRGDEGYHSGNKVELTDLVPLNRAHEEEINNKFGAGVETDERFSLSIGEDFEEIFGGESSSNILDEGLKALKDVEVNSDAIKKIANGLIREYGSTYDKDTFAGNLEKIFAYIKNTDHLNYQDMLEIISDVAMPVIREATEKDPESVRAYNQFIADIGGTAIRLTEQQEAEVEYAFGSYNEFRKMIMPLRISRNGTVDLDQIWGEIVDKYGYALDSDISAAYEPIALYDLYQAMKPTVVNSYGGYEEDISRELGLRIIEEYMEYQTKENTQKSRAKVKELREALAKLKTDTREWKAKKEADYNERLQKAREELKRRSDTYANMTKDLNVIRDEERAKIMARNKEIMSQRAKRAEKTQLKKKIKQNANKLQTWINHPTEEHHIPSKAIGSIVKFLHAMDFVKPEIVYHDNGQYKGLYTTSIYEYYTIGPDGKREFHFTTLSGHTENEVLKKYDEALARGLGGKGVQSWAGKMQDMADLLTRVNKPNNEDDLSNFEMMLDPTIADQFSEMLKRNENSISLNNASYEDLKLVSDVMSQVMHAINMQNKAFTMAHNMSDLAAKTIEKSKTKKTKAHRPFFNKMSKFLLIDQITPDTFFSMMGEPGENLMKALTDANNTKLRDLQAAEKFMKSLGINQKDIKKESGKNATIYHFDLSQGSIDLTIAQIMSIYELNKRKQAVFHFKGGIVSEPKVINGKETKSQKGYATADDIKKITDVLTDKQKKIADKMQQYLANECAEQGNEASRLMYDIEKFNDPDYFPIRTDSSTIRTMNSNTQVDSLNGIERSGFTKSVVENASNPIVIRDIYDVFTDHVTQMAAYHGYAPAVKDVIRWLNYKTIGEEEGGFKSYVTVKEAINANAYRVDNAGVDYVVRLLKDINGTEKNTEIQSFLSGLIGSYKGAAIGGNLRVVIQQPTAVMRARMVVPEKYFAKALPSVLRASKEMRRIKEISPIAWWKSQGYYETSVGKSIREILTGQESIRDSIIEKSMWLAGKADDITWAYIYNAVEAEQKSIHKNDNLTEEEFRKAVNDRFDEVITQTQVVDATLQKSQLMRDTSTISKLRTAFMAEPNKSYNMAVKSMLGDYDEHGANVLKWKMTGKALVVLAITDILNSIAQAIIDGLRYKDDDDEYLDTAVEYFKSNLLDNINPANRVPIIKDVAPQIWSAWKGESKYGSNTAGQGFDMQAISSITDAITTAVQQVTHNYNKTGYAAYMTYAKALSNATGIPVYNLSREFTAIYNLFADAEHDLVKSVKSNPYTKIYMALDDNKSDKKVKELVDKAMANNGVLKNIESGITTRYKSDYYEMYSMGETEEADKIAAKAAKGFRALGLSEEEIESKIEEWQEKSEGYKGINDAIKTGEDIPGAVQRVLEEKDPDKVTEYVLKNYGDTIEYDRNAENESEIEQNVRDVFREIDPNLNYDEEYSSYRENAETSAELDALKSQMFDAIDGSGDYIGISNQMIDTGSDPKNIKSDLTTQYKNQYIKLAQEKNYEALSKLQQRIAQIKANCDKKSGLEIAKKYNGDYYKYEVDQIKKWIE